MLSNGSFVSDGQMNIFGEREDKTILEVGFTAEFGFILIFVLFKYDFRTEVLYTPSSTRLGFKLMTSRSLQYISCHIEDCSNHSAISDFYKINVLPHYLRGLRSFQMHGSQID